MLYPDDQISMRKPTLRPYQLDYYNSVLSDFGSLQNLLMVLPTGGGKTTIFGQLTEHWFNNNKRVLVIVHRVELVDQVVETVQRFNLKCGIIASGYPRDYGQPIQVGMIQSLPDNLPSGFDYIIIDECHHCVAGSYAKLWQAFPKAKKLGVTATPIRTDRKGFEDHFNKMIDLVSLPWLIKHGYLVKPKHYFCSNLGNVSIHNGEYDFTEMSKIMREQRHIADVIESYQRYVPGKRAVVFAVDVNHSKLLAERFNEKGITAEHIDGEMPKEIRKAAVNRFKAGKTLVLCNFNIVSEGFDVPAIEAVILAKRSKSLSWYLQSIGRALRTDPNGKKKYGYVLDCASAYLDHGFAGIAYQWTLDADRDTLLESITKTNQFKRSRSGEIESVLPTEELIGVEMIAFSEEYDIRCANIEMCIEKARQGEEHLSEAILHYNDILTLEGKVWTDVEINYAQKRTGFSINEIHGLIGAVAQ